VDLFWPGDERAGSLASGEALLRAMAEVEAAWLEGLVLAGVAPPAARVRAADLIGGIDGAGIRAELEAVADGAEAGGNPVVPFVLRLRGRLPEPARLWLHRGLTSQDVLDTALVLCLREVTARLASELRAQVVALVELVETHRHRGLAARAAPWLSAVLDAADTLSFAGPGLAAQFGGPGGTLAATTELTARAGLPAPDRRALEITAGVSRRLGLAPTAPWHTARGRLVRFGDALVGATGAWGRIARDIARELARGSSVPERNRVLAVLIRRAALSAPALGATLHAAAADDVDERPEGAWHVEWPTLATLSRRTVVAASQTSELLAGLLAGLPVGLEAPGPEIRGHADGTVDAVLERARLQLKDLT
jgi:3-carboxy-cis,cis-muconate cycloisomerase